MTWQDVVIHAAQIWFWVGLWPLLPRAVPRPPWLTCWGTGVGLAVIAVAFSSLGLWLSAGSAALCAVTWLYLGLDR